MSSYTTIRVDREGSDAARLTLIRAEKRNAINTQMAEEIDAAVRALEEDGVRIASLHAEGPAFCAGADLGDLETAGAAVQSVLRTFTRGRIHWTAVVEAAARGAALGILAVCPRVLATPTASFGLPEVARGFFPADLIAAQIDALGARAAFDLAFTAEPISATRAAEIGLVSKVVESDAVEADLAAETERLRSYPAEGLHEGLVLWSERSRALLKEHQPA